MEINLNDLMTRKYYLSNGNNLYELLEDSNFYSFFQLFYNLIELQKIDYSNDKIEKYIDIPENRIIFLLYIKKLYTYDQIPLDFNQDFLLYIETEFNFDEQAVDNISTNEITLDIQFQSLNKTFIRNNKMYLLIPDLETLIRLNLTLIKLLGIKLRKCTICNSYFPNKMKRSNNLCRYKHIGQASCSYKQAQRNAKNKLKSDELLRQYQQQYKRIYMRVDRAMNKSMQDGNIYTPANLDSFQEWSQSMAETRKKYIDKEINKDEFSQYLEELDLKVTVYNDKLILG